MQSLMQHSCRLLDFNVYDDFTGLSNEEEKQSDNDEENEEIAQNKINFVIQMFGLNEYGESYSLKIHDFNPFFYVKVGDNWTLAILNAFVEEVKSKIPKYISTGLLSAKFVNKKILSGFDDGKLHKFVHFEFANMMTFNKVKNLWYKKIDKQMKLDHKGYVFQKCQTRIYESNIPPLLRFMHLFNISSSGWVEINSLIEPLDELEKLTTCNYEFILKKSQIKSLPNKETIAPFKIMSFDIEASSSHGDFPIPVKSYKKLATDIIEYIEKREIKREILPIYLKYILTRAFNLSYLGEMNEELQNINVDLVYTKEPIKEASIRKKIEQFAQSQFKNTHNVNFAKIQTIETMFEKMHKKIKDAEENADEDDDTDSVNSCIDEEVNDNENEEELNEPAINEEITKVSNTTNIIQILCDKTITREEKLNELNKLLCITFPKLQGDKVTFIGSTFLRYGEKNPYMNNCIALGGCDNLQNIEIESYETEANVIKAWTDLVQRENPDIIIGYNIFGFDYEFLFRRAEENDCIEEFLKLSRNKNEICGLDAKSGKYHMTETTINIASGEHILKYIKMPGRVQVDLYNHFRRSENLESYKLDYVSGYFIGDYVNECTFNKELSLLTIKTGNLTGLMQDSYIHIQIIDNSTDYFNSGAKYNVIAVNLENKTLEIRFSQYEYELLCEIKQYKKWCLAKDDVTPKEIFALSLGSDKDRSIIAKYCIQDCNLVHYLLNKVDIITGFIEMSNLCSVPISFLVFRGQGIKLTSYVAKKCLEDNILMPVLDKGNDEDGYEGAICLPPKCKLYLKTPVACVDFASLYPSVMCSENIAQNSKVWTKEYNLQGILIRETGVKNKSGEYIYDNIPQYTYVNITYDTFKYERKSAKSKAIKIKCGYKVCRFVNTGVKAIMPSILEELLTARKTTRKLIPQQTDDFMKRVLDQRQLAYKITANSLYGQCGSRTSTFYDKDVAASTTASGRLHLLYAKRVIEEIYGNKECMTLNYGMVRTKSSVICGDTDSVFFALNLETMEGEKIEGKKSLEITIELAQQVGELASKFLKKPHDLEYEKTFFPFCLLAKKKYDGMLYETDVNKGKRKSMGNVSKRRDNAPVVKDVFGEVCNILMKEQNLEKSINFMKQTLRNLVDEKLPIEKLIITKSLRSGYKNPQSIAHKVLADRIAMRDSGNKPTSGDRIPYVYIHNPNKNALQGEKIETPTYIREKGIKIDYSFYISNQIMKPMVQLYSLVLEEIWELYKKPKKIEQYKKTIAIMEKKYSVEKYEKELKKLKDKEIQTLLFDEFLIETTNKKKGQIAITSFFGKK